MLYLTTMDTTKSSQEGMKSVFGALQWRIAPLETSPMWLPPLRLYKCELKYGADVMQRHNYVF